VVDLNPKTMPTEELYGHISLASREWKDGLLSSILRDLGQIPDEKPKWMVLDGDLDANWIESMNSVMDDNKMLTLASNERIPLKAHMRMVFEIRDLRYATPATVSRAGVLYIPTESGSQWKSLIASWVQSRPDAVFTEKSREVIRDLFDKYVPDTLGFMRRELKTVLPREEVTLVATLLRLLQGILTSDVTRNASFLEHAFVFASIWAFGSALGVSDDGVDYRAVFSDWWRATFKVGRPT
jgi:dynein heavy chain